MQYFNIQVASQVSGVTSATIRAWEKRYNTVTPERASNGHRLYSNDDIQKLTLLSRLTEIGHNIGKIARLDIEELKEVYFHVFNHPFENAGISSKDPTVEFKEIFQNISRAIEGRKFQIVGHELEKALLIANPAALSLQVILPLIQTFKESKDKEALSSLISFFLGKIIWDKVSKHFGKEEVIIFSSSSTNLLPLILGVVLLDKGIVPYFIFNSEKELEEFIQETPNLRVYTFSDLKIRGVLTTKIPSEADFFHDFLLDLTAAPQQRKPLL